MIVFLLMCILAIMLAGPTGAAFVLGGYAVLFIFGLILNLSEA